MKSRYSRRQFLRDAAASSIVLAIPKGRPSQRHLISFSWDDGFRKSFYRVAEIHENYGSSACLNVIATGHFPDFKAIDQWIRPELMGDFDDWNLLKSRGHEVMPHTWEHLNLTKVSMTKAEANIDKCLDYFEAHLDGYKAEEAVYNFAFNASTPALESYVLRRTRAVRTWGKGVLNNYSANDIPSLVEPLTLGCTFYGPGHGDDFVESRVNEFLSSPGGWLILNLHGLDGEGWGPLHSDYYDKLLARLTKLEHVDVLPVGRVLA